jgi:hypothetical protein
MNKDWAMLGFSPMEFHGDTAYFSERSYGEGDLMEPGTHLEEDPFQMVANHSIECPEQVTLNHALYASPGGNIWCDFAVNTSYRLDSPLKHPRHPCELQQLPLYGCSDHLDAEIWRRSVHLAAGAP